MSYELTVRRINGITLITSPDLPGVYVADRSEKKARELVPSYIKAIERTNKRTKKRKEIALQLEHT